MKPIEKTDPLTGEIFIAFRANQIFASDENRMRYNNLKAKELRESKSEIDKPLLINFRILNELMAGKNEEVFHKQFLLGKGFSLAVMTHKEIKDGKGYASVYNFMMVPLEDSEKTKNH